MSLLVLLFLIFNRCPAHLFIENLQSERPSRAMELRFCGFSGQFRRTTLDEFLSQKIFSTSTFLLAKVSNFFKMPNFDKITSLAFFLGFYAYFRLNPFKYNTFSSKYLHSYSSIPESRSGGQILKTYWLQFGKLIRDKLVSDLIGFTRKCDIFRHLRSKNDSFFVTNYHNSFGPSFMLFLFHYSFHEIIDTKIANSSHYTH